MKHLLALTLFIATFTAHAATGLTGKVEVLNPNGEINNGTAQAIVEGGQPPYQYFWPQAGTPTTSMNTTDVHEGVAGVVTVVDANNNTLVLEYKVPTESISEAINALFDPVVDAFGAVLFYDPFSAIGIYDPVLHDKQGNVLLNANGTPKTKGIPLVVVWLIFGCLYFTFRMKFLNVWGFKHALDLVRGRYDKPGDEGEVTHFQALTAALSGTLGLGNIAGVAFAIAIGGAGATFWMIVAGLLGMCLKFAECTLGVKYRSIDADGQVFGGPMHYLSKGLALRGWSKTGKVLAVLFAIMCVGGTLGGGNMFQANQAFAQVQGDLPFMQEYGAWFGLAMAILVGLVIIGGIKGIARVSDKLVPFMVGLYILLALIIIGTNIGEMGNAFRAIIDGAFAADALKGGFIGVLIVGFQRASFSNEAGVGSASIAHAAAKTNEPVSEGIVALLEPFFDTVVVCTITALVIIFTGLHETAPEGMTGSQLTTAAFSRHFHWFRYVLTFIVCLFAFATMISWSYYGQKAWAYMFGHSKWVDYSYKLLFLACTVIGAATSAGSIVVFSDMMILGMAFPNLLGLLIMSKEISLDTKNYFKRLKSGEIKRYK